MGFGPFVPAGGLGADRRALGVIDDDDAQPRHANLHDWLLELATLTPAAWLAAVWALKDGVSTRVASALWPWVLAVPAGFSIVLLGMVWVRLRDSDPDRSGPSGFFPRLADGGWTLLGLLRHPRCSAPAVVGMVGYWACDVASFYAAPRVVGLHVDLRLVIVAYGTGYALTRRSLPLGGAGITELLLTFALVWVAQPMVLFLAAVVIDRVFTFLLPAVPALFAHNAIEPLIAGGAYPAAQLLNEPVSRLTDLRRRLRRLRRRRRGRAHLSCSS